MRRPSAEVRPFKAIEVTLEECDGSFERMLRRYMRRFREDGPVGELSARRQRWHEGRRRNRRTEKNGPRE